MGATTGEICCRPSQCFLCYAAAHDNDYGWWENEEKLQLARAQGYNVWGEYYPFTAGSTIVSADILRPEVWEKVNGYKYEETIYHPGADKFLTKDEYLTMVKEKPGYFKGASRYRRVSRMLENSWICRMFERLANDLRGGV